MRLKTASFSRPALLAASISLLVFARAVTCDFVNFDDPHYVYDNPAISVLDLQFIMEAFKTSYMGWWMPLTWISLALDYAVWGLNPLGFHLTNILLHAVNTGLVVMVGVHLLPADDEKWPWQRYLPFLAALLWGLHPLRVESVAWVTERKDVLNGFFSLSSILLYLSYVATPVSLSKRRIQCYGGALICFALSVMAKPASVVFPVLYLLLDWYPLKRLDSHSMRQRLWEKIPFLLVSAGTVAVTLCMAAGESILVPFKDYPLGSRILAAGYGLVEYIRLTLWPAGLTHLYPIQPQLPPMYYVYSFLVLCLAVAAVYVRKKQPWLMAGGGSFILLLLPVLGLLQNGSQSHADRFTYLPAVVPTILLVGAMPSTFPRWLAPLVLRRLLIGIFIALPVIYGGLSFHQIGYWRNSGKLWTRVIEINPIGRAYYYRGDYAMGKKDYNAAAADFAVAAAMAREAGNPELFNIYALQGEALSRGGRFSEAVEAFSAAIALDPNPNYFYHRGAALQRLGRATEAERDFSRAGGDNSPIVWRSVQ